MSNERIEALEKRVTQLADELMSRTAMVTAQSVTTCAVVELIGQAGVTLDDVQDHATTIAAGMPEEVDTAVRTLLAEAPVGRGGLQ